ncbi:MAG: hypothetical protein ACOX7N_09960 [Lawsonibacter sp.]|jgi:hypothetical protein
MKSSWKRAIYWVVYGLLLFGTVYIKATNRLPIQTTSVFLFGLMWIWKGVSLLCGINPDYAQRYARKVQFVFGITSLGMGITWSIISLTQFSKQVIPMVLISTPFLIPDFVLFLRDKKRKG